MDKERIVASVIAASNNEIVGRTRIQKTFYLLDQLGLNSGFSFEYHHYGPYSAELFEAIEDAKVFVGVKENPRHRSRDGVPYSVFSLESLDDVFELPSSLQSAIQKMNQHTATVLELAATIHWLAKTEKIPDWKQELVVRKERKTEGGRMETAEQLLSELGISIQ
jgi:uncharacterized protein YwgA